ncbi:tetratricopeptide repeat protein [Desulfovibrio psychrotolerans]|uniref:Uncharacterized protein n=1 Tax=Desulfovibrio psychrotolerans TaxID=415242 RepID=A0A7J0BNY6_9BACT|nr:tetratricopeptide repeat protein [Desulfovibrio psychrotolerans]GFM35328.1 hypothetical protein DSM19430T_00120 [Desulfovibrio psychrotolerans]
MRIHPLYVLTFFASMLLLTLLIYPSQRDMAQLYLDSGSIQRAWDILEKVLPERTDDYALHITASEIYHLLGRPERAIDMLIRARELKPRNVAMLTRLARYLEWDMRPRDALPIYEEIAASAPDRTDVLRTLVSHYRYFGMPDRESHALARLLMQDAYAEPLRGIPLLVVLRSELTALAQQRLAGEYTPLRDLLMQQLFIIGDQFAAAVQEGEQADEKQYATYCLEDYLKTGHLPKGAVFAQAMDSRRGGVDIRLHFATIMQWNNLLGEAVAYLRQVHRQVPGNEAVLIALSSAARNADDLETVEFALEALTRSAPENREYTEQLAEVYLEGNKIAKAIEMFDALLQSAVDTFRVLGRMLTAALFSGEPEVMRVVLEKAESYPTDRKDILESRIELHLALDQTGKAYTLLRDILKDGTPDHAQLLRLMEIAQFTGDAPTILDAVDFALRHEPENIDFLRQGSDALLATERPGEAFTLLKRLARISRNTADALAMLETAGFTASTALVDEAADIAHSLHPTSATVMDRITEVYLWLESPLKSLPYAEKAARLSRGDRALTLRMVEVASYTGDGERFRKALMLAGKLRPDDEEIALASAQALAAGGEGAAFEALLERFMRSGSNVNLIRKWAAIAENAGLSEQAFRLWYQVHKASPHDSDLREKVARLAFNTGRYSISADLWSRIADNSPAAFDPAFAAGSAWAAAGNVEKAFVYFEKALALRPDNRPAMLEFARNAAYSGRYSRAVQAFERLGTASLEENDRILLAEAYGNTGKAREALALFGPLLNKDPLPKERAILITQLYNAAEQRAKAAALYPKLGNAYGDDPAFVARLGAEAFFAEHSAPALALFSKVLESKPDDATALKGSALVHAENSNVRSAIDFFREYIRRYPGDGDAHFRLAELYTILGKEGPAQREYREATRLLKEKLRSPPAPDAALRKRQNRKNALDSATN